MPAASDLTVTFGVAGSGTCKSALDLSSPNDPVQVGRGNFDEVSIAFTFGTGNSQVKEWFHDERTILAGANDDLDLSGALLNPFGTLIAGTRLKWILVDIEAPDGTKSLRVGPQGVANAFQGWHGGVAAGNYNTVHRTMFLVEPYAGWAITATTGDILRINNPGAGSVTYRIWLGFLI